MKRIYARAIAMSLTVMLLLLNGCTPSKTSNVSISFPEEYSYEGSQLTASFQVEAPENLNVQETEAQYVEIDYESLNDYLLPNGQWTDDNIYFQENQENDADGEPLAYSSYENHLYSYYNNKTDEGIYVGSAVYDEERNPLYNLDRYTEPQTFSFATADEALQEVETLLQEAGVPIDETWQVETFYLDYETMQEEEYHYVDVDGSIDGEYCTDWSEEDNTYLFLLTPTCGQLPVYYRGTVIYDWAGGAASAIRVYYNADGILRLDCGPVVAVTAADEPLELLSLDEIMEPVIQKYESVISDSTYEIRSGRLYLCVMEDAGTIQHELQTQLRWAFQVTEHRADGTDQTLQVCCDAVNGGIIVE